MWIRAVSSVLPKDVNDRVEELIGGEPSIDAIEWVNLETGALLVLCVTGNWRDGADAELHAVSISPSGSVADASIGLLGSVIRLDPNLDALRRLSEPRQRAALHIESILGVEYHTVPDAPETIVTNVRPMDELRQKRPPRLD